MSGWVKLHRKILDDPVWTSATTEQKVVLITVLLLADHEARQWYWKGRKFETQPGQFITSLNTLLKKSGVSIKSIRTAIARFEKLNFLANEPAKTGRLISIKNWARYQSSVDGGGKETGKEVAKTGQLTRSKEVKKESIPIKFETFWQTYPKKQSKQNALKAWRKIDPDEGLLTVILSALKAQKDSDQWQQNNGQFIPHASTWLNQRRWEDEIESPDKQAVNLQIVGGRRVY